MTEVRGAAGADGAQIVVPLLSPEIPGQLPRLQGTCRSPLSLGQGAPAEVEVLPGAHHLPATGGELLGAPIFANGIFFGKKFPPNLHIETFLITPQEYLNAYSNVKIYLF